MARRRRLDSTVFYTINGVNVVTTQDAENGVIVGLQEVLLSPPSETAWDALNSHGYTTFREWAAKGNLESALSDPDGNWTVFAVSDEVLDQLTEAQK